MDPRVPPVTVEVNGTAAQLLVKLMRDLDTPDPMALEPPGAPPASPFPFTRLAGKSAGPITRAPDVAIRGGRWPAGCAVPPWS